MRQRSRGVNSEGLLPAQHASGHTPTSIPTHALTAIKCLSPPVPSQPPTGQLLLRCRQLSVPLRKQVLGLCQSGLCSRQRGLAVTGCNR